MSDTCNIWHCGNYVFDKEYDTCETCRSRLSESEGVRVRLIKGKSTTDVHYAISKLQNNYKLYLSVDYWCIRLGTYPTIEEVNEAMKALSDYLGYNIFDRPDKYEDEVIMRYWSSVLALGNSREAKHYKIKDMYTYIANLLKTYFS